MDYIRLYSLIFTSDPYVKGFYLGHLEGVCRILAGFSVCIWNLGECFLKESD